MAKTKGYSYPLSWNWKTVGNVHILTRLTHLYVYLEDGFLDITVDRGYKCDGASTPSIFQWIFKSWYGDIRDLPAVIHDVLFCIEGKTDGKNLSFEDCNDILRGLTRDVQVLPRWKASLVDMGVSTWIAKKHFGTDEYNVKDKIRVKFVEY